MESLSEQEQQQSTGGDGSIEAEHLDLDPELLAIAGMDENFEESDEEIQELTEEAFENLSEEEQLMLIMGGEGEDGEDDTGEDEGDGGEGEEGGGGEDSIEDGGEDIAWEEEFPPIYIDEDGGEEDLPPVIINPPNDEGEGEGEDGSEGDGDGGGEENEGNNENGEQEEEEDWVSGGNGNDENNDGNDSPFKMENGKIVAVRTQTAPFWYDQIDNAKVEEYKLYDQKGNEVLAYKVVAVKDAETGEEREPTYNESTNCFGHVLTGGEYLLVDNVNTQDVEANFERSSFEEQFGYEECNKSEAELVIMYQGTAPNSPAFHAGFYDPITDTYEAKGNGGKYYLREEMSEEEFYDPYPEYNQRPNYNGTAVYYKKSNN